MVHTIIPPIFPDRMFSLYLHIKIMLTAVYYHHLHIKYVPVQVQKFNGNK